MFAEIDELRVQLLHSVEVMAARQPVEEEITQ